MGLIKSLAGIVRVKITSALPAKTLSAANQHEIMLMNVAYISELEVEVSIYRTDYRRLSKIVEKNGGTIKMMSRMGLYWQLKGFLKRPVLLLGILICLILTVYLPSRILFIQVDGNNAIPSKLILEKAEACGISFGIARRHVRSEQIKNALLSEIPELQWVGVNTSGCTAVICVRERSVNEKTQPPAGVSSIVAERDGVILACTVLRGNPLCKVGQAVKKGQVLVSGYVDCGLVIKATGASAEITAQTLRDLTAISPKQSTVRSEIISSKKQFSIQIGKKLIKFSNDSGISDSRCVKMYKKKYLTLPGGFALPVALIREETVLYDTQPGISSLSTDEALSDYAEAYLKGHMIAGQILQKDISFLDSDETRCMYGKFNCIEIIGKAVNEELIQKHGESD